MSVAVVKQFSVKLVGDEALATRINNAASVDERLRIAHERGCDFTREEFEATTAEIVPSDASFGEVFGGAQGEVVGYAALSMVPVQSVIRPLYWDSWFFEHRAQVNIIRSRMQRPQGLGSSGR